ncbi:epoxyqueuosine reductase [Desulfatirhabdium butyrativorans]|uniref:epoxyqueuosine reductase n=1 Tax=Desulfatirhabdium butyrativorans TaxID=340467 RepID=UPI00040D522A|nr:4Fe-4S double cluster binding domain-containing protein [Desulfatirhabdium butyrativorans]
MKLTKRSVSERALELGFASIGFTDAKPFYDHQMVLEARKSSYDWIYKLGLDLSAGIDPKAILPDARSIIVVLAHYFDRRFPPEMENHFGRCYLDDDRVTRDGLSLKIKALRDHLLNAGIKTKIPFHLPHRVAAARAGLGTFGKNCLLYANSAVARGSWILPIAFVVDAEFEPDTPTTGLGCPDWCKNACLICCPTGALKGPRKIEPRRCISYLTYFGEGLTPRELREPMGLWIYGCDHCQNVCPRNRAWLALAKTFPINAAAEKMMPYFALPRLLHMDTGYFEAHIQPHMFYMPSSELWRWHMNVARAMGNTLDTGYVPELIRAFEENADERVKSMAAWALGRIGGAAARSALDRFRSKVDGTLKDEVAFALTLS